MLASDASSVERNELGHPGELDAGEMGNLLVRHRSIAASRTHLQGESRAARFGSRVLLGTANVSLCWLVEALANAAADRGIVGRLRCADDTGTHAIRDEYPDTGTTHRSTHCS